MMLCIIFNNGSDNKMISQYGCLTLCITEAAVDEGQTIICDSMKQFDNPHHNTVTSTAGKYVITFIADQYSHLYCR